MERASWVTWAFMVTLMGLPLLANVYATLDLAVDAMVEQAQALPGPRAWYYPGLDFVLLGAPILQFLVAAVIVHAWAKVRAKGVEERKLRAIRPQNDEDDEDPDERPMAPPGFLQGPKIRKKRKGLAPLITFTLLAVVLAVAGAIVLLLAGDSLWSATFYAGERVKTASIDAQILRFVMLPMFTLGGMALGLAWGRWFPLGELEITVERQAADRPSQNFRWQQEY